MTLTQKGYKKRIIDKKIESYLKTFGAVTIEGPKWCGKTWTSLNHAQSVCYISDPTGNFQNRELAKLNPEFVLEGSYPRLIDEWQEVPSLWDSIRFWVDQSGKKGQFLLTGSSTPRHKGILHSGAGRFGILRMRTMSLFETEDSKGVVNIKSLFNKKIESQSIKKTSLKELIYFCIRGGWPGAIGKTETESLEMSKSYLETVISNDMFQLDGVKRDIRKVRSLIHSLARNESTLCSNSTLKKDVESLDKIEIDPSTISDYLNNLTRLFLLEDQPSFYPSVRSSRRFLQSPKRHFTDVSLTIAAMKLNSNLLFNDLNTFGYLFEALCIHDLRIYTEAIGGNLYHMRDNRENEIDAIVELADGRWGAIEIKLGSHQIDEAARNLLRVKNIITKEGGKEPDFLCVVCGLCPATYTRDDGVHVVPITAIC